MYLQNDVSNAIRRVQTYLYEIHLRDGNPYIVLPDGIYGATTKNAVLDFQKQQNLPSTGIVDFSTFEMLRETAKKYQSENSQQTHLYSTQGFPIQIGARGADVDVLHALLRSLFEYENEAPPIPRTAYFSAETEQAVQYMQRTLQIEADGVVTAELFERLKKELKARQNFRN